MRVIAFDTETALTSPGLQAPPLACLSWAERKGSEVVKKVVSRHDALPLVRSWLENDDVVLVGHNTAFDTVVCMNAAEEPGCRWGFGSSEHFPVIDLDFRRKLFRKYERGEIHCTMLRERLLELSRGTLDRPKGWYSLGRLAKEYFGMELDKTDDSWRYRYGELIPIPFEQWPEASLKYAGDDAVATLLLFERQGQVADSEAQARAGFVFQLIRCWGMRTDPEKVELLEQRLIGAVSQLESALRRSGILRADGSQDMKLTQALIEASYPGEVPRTPTGRVKTGNEIVDRCSHPALEGLSDYKDAQKLLTTFVPVVKRGLREPICPYVNIIVKNGRTSYRDPNLQNLPRKGGVRECFVPRPGKVFVDVDYDTLELRTFAQVLLEMVGGKTLAEQYQKDPDFDPHTRLASRIIGIEYEQGLALKKKGDTQLKDMRQMSKCGNFGYAGGMGPKTMVDYAWKSYGVKMDLDQSKKLKQDWVASIPEVAAYFKICSNLTANQKRATIKQLYSGRIRGGMVFTDVANGFWSGLAADGVKFASWNVVKACYVLPENIMFGTRPVVMIHDQLMSECDEEIAAEVGAEQARIMTESMQVFTPAVPSRASPQLMRRWRKDAEPVFDDNGRLMVYDDWKDNQATCST